MRLKPYHKSIFNRQLKMKIQLGGQTAINQKCHPEQSAFLVQKNKNSSQRQAFDLHSANSINPVLLSITKGHRR